MGLIPRLRRYAPGLVEGLADRAQALFACLEQPIPSRWMPFTHTGP